MSSIMAHMVVGYPDANRALQVAQGLADGGADYLELQFPFSDPTADGPAIQAACQQALEGGFTVDHGLAFVRSVTETTRLPVYIMTYASVAFRRGVTTFLEQGVAAGASGFIIPDLPPDYDEGAYAAAAALGTEMMPVTVATASHQRLDALRRVQPAGVYAALRAGITGDRTTLGEANLRFLQSLRAITGRVFAGFGIQSRDQVVELEPHVHASVVGSAFVRVVAQHQGKPASAIREAVAGAARALVGVDPAT